MKNKAKLNTELAGPYRSAIIVSLVFQLFVFLFSAATMDYGVMFRTALLALLPYWIATIWIASKRPNNPSSGDIFFIKYGFLEILLGFYLLAIFGFENISH